MKRIFLLLFFIGFIGHKARGNYDDPAPGRSPGPPLQQTSSSLQLANDFYSIEASHEAYRPHETSSKLQQQQQLQNDNNPEVGTIMNNENRFSDIFSSMSRENIEYHDNTNENYNNHDFIATTDDNDDDDDDDGMVNIHRHKLIIDKSAEMTGSLQQNDSDDETALNALKNSSLSSQPTHVSSSSRPNLDTVIMNSINPISENNANETIKMMKMVESIRSDKNNENGCGPSAKVLKYLSLGDKVVKINLSDSDKEPRIPSEMGRLQVYVTHDVFSTETSLLAGIIYKGKVSP